jgi:hypothetical protein
MGILLFISYLHELLPRDYVILLFFEAIAEGLLL